MRELHHPSPSGIRLSSVLHALSDPARLQIVKYLWVNGEQVCSKCCHHGVKSTMSHHLRVLREAGIIEMKPSGVQIVNALRIQTLEDLFPGLLTSIVSAVPLQDCSPQMESEIEASRPKTAEMQIV